MGECEDTLFTDRYEQCPDGAGDKVRLESAIFDGIVMGYYNTQAMFFMLKALALITA